jgi:hypothetical protein
MQRAVFAYAQFRNRFSASQAENAPRGGFDLPIIFPIQVSREDMLNRFLEESPEFEPFRIQLAESCKRDSDFSVNRDLWQASAS